MKHIVTIILVVALSLPGFCFAATYGKGVRLDTRTPISAILEQPDQYLGKTVVVEGIVLEVCARRGCWIYLAGEQPGQKLQIKVTDGEIVFPMSAAGSMATVEGVVEELQLSREEMVKYLQHLAEEKGQPFDPSTVKDERFIRIRGIGAEIDE